MKPQTQRLAKLQIRNFKAIRNSGVLNLTPFTAIVGNNGSGKSSLIEALEFLYIASVRDLPSALERWLGFEHVWNKFSGPGTSRREAKPMGFHLRGDLKIEGDIGSFDANLLIGYVAEGTEAGYLTQTTKIQSPRKNIPARGAERFFRAADGSATNVDRDFSQALHRGLAVPDAQSR